ncbi:MAG: sulfotransferase [Methyloligellaceae bacterium]
MTVFNTEVSAIQVDGDNVITKRPMDCLRWREIVERHSETKFIVTIRDPRSMVTSRHPVFERYTASWDHYLAGHEDPIEFEPGGIVNLARHIREMEPFAEIVRYEDLTADPQAVQRRLGRLGLAFCGTFETFHEREPGDWPALGGKRPPDPKGKEKWRNDPDRIREQFTACPELFDLVEEYGYEPDRSWFEAL